MAPSNGLCRKESTADVFLPPAVMKAALGMTTPLEQGPVEIKRQGCVLSLRGGGLAAPGRTPLLVLTSNGRKENCACDSASEEKFFEMLEQTVVTSGRDLSVIYDIRGGKIDSGTGKRSSPNLANLCAFLGNEQRATAILRGARSIAILVAGNIFKEDTLSPLRSFLGELAPSCPFLISHSASVAEDFFEVVRGGEVSFFVSVVGVQPAMDTNDVKTCVASLTPMSKATGVRNLHAHAESPSTYFKLPNGDVRVIQSPPYDVVMGQSMTGEVVAETEHAGDSSCESASRYIRPKPSYALCRGDLPSITALLFQAPTAESLQMLKGAHFHIGELVADAEMESRSRARVRSQSKKRLGLAKFLYFLFIDHLCGRAD